MARRERSLLALVVLTAYIAVMSRWCNKGDLVTGFISNGRYRPELENMIGFVANMLHLHVEVTEGDSFLDLLKRLNREIRSAYDHQDFDRVPAFIPECATDLQFNWLPTHWSQGFVCQHREADDKVRVQQFPFRVIQPCKFTPFSDTAAGINVTVLYGSDRFAPSTIEHSAIIYGCSRKNSHSVRSLAWHQLRQLKIPADVWAGIAR